MARICPLFSSSSGNCTYIKDGENGILIDAGVSFKNICEALISAGGTVESIKAVAITHEHTDHIKGLKTLINKTGVPLFASKDTAATLIKRSLVPDNTKIIPLEKTEEIAGFGIERFDTSHDCVGSSGYNVFLKDGRKITVCTDLGVVTDTVREHIKGSEVLLFESNHDVEMLKRGPYDARLKLRILSDKGHLSNFACAAELVPILKSGTTRFILGHLSQNNNLPMLAKSAAKNAFVEAGAEENKDYILMVAKPLNNGVITI